MNFNIESQVDGTFRKGIRKFQMIEKTRSRLYLLTGFCSLVIALNSCIEKKLTEEKNECVAVEILRPTDIPNNDIGIFKIIKISDTLYNTLLSRSFDSITCGKEQIRCDFTEIKSKGAKSMLISFISYETSPIRDSVNLLKFCHEKYDNSYLKVYSHSDVVIIKNHKNKELKIKFLPIDNINKILGISGMAHQ